MPTGLETFRAKYPGAYDNIPDEQLADALYKKHYSQMPRDQFDEKMGLERWDPHREEKFDVGMGQILPSVGRAAKALPGSAAHAGEQLWDLVTNYDKVYANVKELGFSGVAKAIGSDLKEHYGSLDKAKKTFETDPFRFLLDISAVTTGGGGLLAKLPGVAGRIGEGVAAAGRAVDPLAMAGRVTAATVREPAAGLLGRTTGTGAQTMRRAEEAGYQGTRLPTAARPLLPQGLRRHGPLSGLGLDYFTGGHVGHLAAQHPVLAGAAAVATSPRLAGSAMYGLGAAQRYGEQLAPAARGAALALPGRKEIRDKAQAALRDPEFKKGKDQEQLKPVRKAARDPNADSRTMQAAQRALGGYRPLQLTVRPAEGGYGGTEGGQSNDATSGVVSRQEGGPVEPGRAYSVGDAPGATPDTPKPETFTPDAPTRITVHEPKPSLDLDSIWQSLLAGKAAPEDPFERAAMTTRESVRPSAGREYTPQAEEFLTSQFTDPTTIALSVAGGPVGRTLPTIAKAALVGGGMLASSIDPAQGGVLGKLGKTLQGKPWAGAAPHMISEMAAPEFHAALSDAKSKAEYGASVTLHDPQAYKGMQTLTTPDKSAGLALEGDNIASVYKHPDSPIRQAAPSLLADAVKLGGRRLDAFDTDLPHIYGRSGFRAVARIPFDPAEAPKDWSYQTYKKWNDGKPDVVFMVYDPYNPGYQRGMGKMVSSYDEAVALQKQEVARIDERMQQASTQFDQTARQVTGLKGVKQYLTPEELEKVTEAGAEELTRMFRTTPPEELAAAAYAGRAKRGWYKQSAQSLVDIFGIADAPRFVALLAAMSPRISVEGNTINALRTWNAWKKAGSPRTRREILNAMLEGVGGTEMKSVMEAWRNNAIRALTSDDPLGLMLSGPKVDSFWRNLIGRMQEVTNDAWMASFHGVDQDLISGAGKVDPAGRIGPEQLKLSYKGKSPGYLGMSAATRRAADTLSRLTGDVWTPAEIQETVWSWAKTLREKVYGAPGKKGVGGTVEQLLKAGGLTHEEVANTPDFATLFTEGVYRNILEAGGYGKQIKQVEKGLTERRAKGGSDLPSGTPFDPEGTTFTGPAFRRHLLRAGRRLDVGAAGAGE